MVIKKMAGNEYRVAYFSEVGMSYLEGTFRGETYPWKLNCNQVSPFLSTGNTIKDLESAFNLLLVAGNPKPVRVKPGEVYCVEGTPSKIIFQTGRKRIFLTLTKI
jgi:hypothetical protein